MSSGSPLTADRLVHHEERFSGEYQRAWIAWIAGQHREAEQAFSQAQTLALGVRPERLLDLIRDGRAQVEDTNGITLPGALR